MSRYLVDTNIWIRFLKQKNPTLDARLSSTDAKEIAVCSIVWAELLHGARKYERRHDREARVRELLSPFHSYAFADTTAPHYAAIRHELESSGSLLGQQDLMIAAIAREHGLVLITNDDGFRRIPGLLVEDWTVP